MKIRIGTRGSDLALAQAYYTQKILSELENPPETEIIIIKTTGDQVQNVALSDIGGNTPDERKGFFTKEIEDALLAREIDIAVHSFKDMPTLDVPGLVIECMPQRLTPFDVLLAKKSKIISEKPPYINTNGTVGTSSVRRISHLQFRWPGIRTSMLRGNVPTRIQRLVNEDTFDAILLSGAGFERLKNQGFFNTPEYQSIFSPESSDPVQVFTLSPEVFVPAPAQGALAIQSRADDQPVKEILSRLHNASEAAKVSAERAVLKALEGGCHLPLGSYCETAEVSSGSTKKQIYRLHVFLGAEAQDNLKKKSYYKVREASDPGFLAEAATDELKKDLPFILTGREDRMKELVSDHAGKKLHIFSLLRIEHLEPEDRASRDLDDWIREAELEIKAGKKPVFSVFSVPGARRIAEIFREKKFSANGIRWGVTGDKTGTVLKQLFPGADIAFVSPDGTGRSLAVLIAENMKSNTPLTSMKTFPAATAHEGREEFFQIMEENHLRGLRLPVYRTVRVMRHKEELAALPERAFVILGSPSAAHGFLDLYENLHGSISDNRSSMQQILCSIGPTTTKAVRERGYDIYMEAPVPDFDLILSELSRK